MLEFSDKDFKVITIMCFKFVGEEGCNDKMRNFRRVKVTEN